MTVIILFALIGISSFAALREWRWGWYGMILVALLQDPLRKMTPGTPAYLVLATVPVWACILLGAWRRHGLSIREFRETFPSQWRVVSAFLLSLVIPVVLSLSYGPGSWQFTLVGLFTQGAFMGGVLLGFNFPVRSGDVERVMRWYCILAAVMMIGAPLEKFHIGVLSGLTGTESLDACWVTYRTGKALFMMSGFFRSPDVLGWHAATLVMFAVTLSLRSERWHRFVWVALAGLGGVALMYCARRKMIAMVPVFGLAMCCLQIVLGHFRSLPRLVLVLGVMGCIALYAYTQVGSDADVEKFYGSTMGELDERVQAHGVDSVVITYQQAGFWGHGLGMAVQGVHHINGARPHIWQESGPSMIMAELGVPGLVAFLAMLVAFLVAGYNALKAAAGAPEYPLFLGMASVIIANLAAAVVSAQIFGDPFIGCFIPFLAGVVLAGKRLEVER